MGQEISAQEKFSELSHTVLNFRESSFLQENPQFRYLEEGFEAVANFLLERPAMLVSDSQNMEVVLQFLNKEWYEAKHADANEDFQHFFAEVGDTVFFAFVSGVLHWDQMDDRRKDFVSRSLGWCENDSQHQSVNLVDAVKYVANEKDPVNYRKDFYQLIEGESVRQVRQRVPTIGKLHRKIRDTLNTEQIAGSGDVLHALAVHHNSITNSGDMIKPQIQTLFQVAGLDLLVHAAA
jgi:hypothetical protein